MPDLDATTDQVTQAPQDGSILSTLKAKREAIARERHVDLDIPGYGGLLVVRCHPVGWEKLKEIGTAAEKDRHPKKELFAQANTLIAATDQLFIRDGGKLKSPDPDGSVVRWDPKLAELLDLGTMNRARDILLAVFNNDVAVSLLHADFSEWNAVVNPEVDEDFSGNSTGTSS